MLESSGFAADNNPDRSPSLEEQRRLYWSVTLLDQFIGTSPGQPDMVMNLSSPTFLTMTPTLNSHPVRCPVLPLDAFDDLDEESPGMWSTLVLLSTVWKKARQYVAECAEGRNTSPWVTSSTYSQINEMLLDAETDLPTSFRYEQSRFSDRSIDTIQRKRHYWIVWIQAQIRYHCIHAVINHPFLYAQPASRHRKGPNVFWRTSAELALLHGSWISRLIEMAATKDLEIDDPFVAKACAVAGTLHLLHRPGSHQQSQTPGEQGLHVCRAFVEKVGRKWPCIRSEAGHQSSQRRHRCLLLTGPNSRKAR